MRLLRAIWKVLGELSGETNYRRYCEHLRLHHPERRLPSEREFFLARLEEKYARPSRCC
jgi:uncharacterized short protein YbdD (DUF466 family)